MSELIAPHQGRELELVLAGKKPLATLQMDNDPQQYLDVYEASARRQVYARSVGEGMVAFTLYPNQHLINKYLDLILGITPVTDKVEYQTAMGKLFGYTDEEIAAFISGDIKCNCKECVGVGKRW